MTTKTLTSDYPGGYVIGAAYNKVVIDLGVTAGSSSSFFGVYSNHTAAIVNYGTLLASTTHIAVELGAGGNVTNGSAFDNSALIEGGEAIGTSASTVTNFGTIEGDTGIGVYLGGGGMVINGSAGDTTAKIFSTSTNAVLAYGSVAETVINFGTISGPQSAVRFHDVSDRLIVENKAVFVGSVAGYGGTMELAGGSDTITSLNDGVMTGSASATFSGFDSFVVDLGAGMTLTGYSALTATGDSLTVDGALTNNGTIKGPLSSGYAVTLSGGELTNGSATDATAFIAGFRSSIYAVTGTSVGITNYGTIEAFGTGNSVGVNMDADGTVINGSATDKSALLKGGYGVYSFDSATTVVNFGSIYGVGGVSVDFHEASDRLVVQSGATFIGGAKGGGGTLAFDGGTGTITGLGGSGVFSVDAHGSFSGFGTYDLYGGAAWTLSGGGTIALGKALDIGASSTATIEGGTLASAGDIAMTSGAVLAGYAGATLSNSGTITCGAIYGTMAVTNGAGGVIDDNAGAMLINNQDGAGLTNNGVIESVGTNTLTLKEVTVSGAGSIEAFGTIKLDAADITSGTVNAETFGVLQVASTISSIGTGVTVDDTGAIRITSGAYLYLSSNITGVGSISIDGVTGTNADLKAVGNVTLSGGGAVSMNVNGFITGYGSSHLTNADTITGGGAIFGSMTVTNSGLIDDDAGAMLINNQSGGGVANTGTLESTNTGVLSLKDVTVTGSGFITDDHQLKLQSATINDGRLTVGGSAILEAISGASTIGSAVKLTNDKTIEVITGGALTIACSIINDGLVETVGTGQMTLQGAITGTGSARLTGSGSLTIDGADSQGVTFAATDTGNLVLGASSAFTGAISGLSKSSANAIDLQGVAYNASDKAKYSGTATGGTLTILSSSNAVLATLTLKGNYMTATWVLSNDGSGDMLVKDPPASGPLAQAIASFAPAASSGAQTTLASAALQPLPLAAHG